MFGARPSICQCTCQYGCFLVTSRFVLSLCVRYDYNSLLLIENLSGEKILLCYCAARDTHFSALVVKCLYVVKLRKNELY